MRYVLLVILVALAVLLVLHYGRGRKANVVEESGVRLDQAKAAALASQLRQVEAALDAYADRHGAYPGGLAELIPDPLRSDDLLIDPWGSRLRLERPGEGGVILASAGPDRSFATRDDIRRSL